MDTLMNAAGIISNIYSELCARNPHFKVKYGNGVHTCPGMLFSVRMRAQHQDTDVERYIHIVLGGDAVHVWVAVSDSYNPADVPLSEWDNPSNHDSCWRSDGVESELTRLYFALCDEVQEGLPDEAKVPPAGIEVSSTLGWLHPMTMVQVQFKPAEDKRGRMSRYELVDVKRIEATLVPQQSGPRFLDS